MFNNDHVREKKSPNKGVPFRRQKSGGHCAQQLSQQHNKVWGKNMFLVWSPSLDQSATGLSGGLKTNKQR
jgi:hypothetical protein